VRSLTDADLDDPRRYTEPLRFFFYLLMFVALLAAFAGATDTAVLMLLAGATLHVVRFSLEETAARRAARRERGKRQVRLRSHRVAARRARVDEEIRVSAASQAAARRQSRASAVRKQRVV
jgi:hypothetical protein